MPNFKWNQEKNTWLKVNRNVSFDDVATAFANQNVIKITDHYNKIKYPNQQIIYFKYANYTYACPFIKEADGSYFLKTVYASRKANIKIK